MCPNTINEKTETNNIIDIYNNLSYQAEINARYNRPTSTNNGTIGINSI